MNSFKIHGSSIKSLSDCELYMFLHKSYISVIFNRNDLVCTIFFTKYDKRESYIIVLINILHLLD